MGDAGVVVMTLFVQVLVGALGFVAAWGLFQRLSR